MPPPGKSWNELGLSEDPLVDLLVRLGWTYVAPEALEAERDSLKETVLTKRLDRALARINPWLTADNRHKSVRALTHAPAVGLLEANETAYTTLTYGTGVEQDVGEGKKNQDVFFLDFDSPLTNEFVVSRQYRLQGTKKQIVPDIVLFVNGVPIAVIECKSPTLGDKWQKDTKETAKHRPGSFPVASVITVPSHAPLHVTSVTVAIFAIGVYGNKVKAIVVSQVSWSVTVMV